MCAPGVAAGRRPCSRTSPSRSRSVSHAPAACAAIQMARARTRHGTVSQQQPTQPHLTDMHQHAPRAHARTHTHTHAHKHVASTHSLPSHPSRELGFSPKCNLDRSALLTLFSPSPALHIHMPRQLHHWAPICSRKIFLPPYFLLSCLCPSIPPCLRPSLDPPLPLSRLAAISS